MIDERELMVALGVASLLTAAILFRKTRRFLETASYTVGEVIGYGIADGTTAGSPSTTIVIRYAVDGKRYRCTELIGIGRKKRYFIGRKVRIRFDGKQPSHARMDSLWRLYFFEIVLAVVGTAALFAVYQRS